MSTITMYSTRSCPFCVQAENLLQRKGLAVNKILVDQNQDDFVTMVERTARRSVPQIFVGNRHVGGFTDLVALEQSGQLDEWLKVVEQHESV
ncbi:MULTISPECIES: glutaredoxin 3 [Deefgea]|jgi:glutaredoxin 3|uniref:Glutaredoxin n=1 Tax=Deefgea chitinilytica TaxID=570276 RepID=A0ABS2CAF4_9NEIS|nr:MULTISPECIES: glutaredoxin 3 [Deefgea]MBM5571124.1 glutaredoxin 3 [Deefgea chitinilytica]MBM9888354.1 glutaredoxin 3 [Deefgea sp. CFH1-16]